ncbi:MAG: sigma-54 dependent transcriptional regulator [Desulfoprunum sp.]|nr:sigma-54 dependent transcriptional regulator [Desulfoprunum sp.]
MQLLPKILLALTDSQEMAFVAEHISKSFDCTPLQVSDEKALPGILQDSPPQILLIDLCFPTPEQIFTLLDSLKKRHPGLIIVPAIPEGRRDLIKKVIARDVFFYLNKPFEPLEISYALKKAAETLPPRQPLPSTLSQPASRSFHGIIGNSTSMKNLFDLITKVADDDYSTILIRGESGTGKELVAKAIHAQSRRSNKNFVPVNCAAIPDDLLESELFGYIKGAFTGATANKPGRIQYSDGGTLFLDEIGDMKSSLQAKLLRVLQEKEFEPVGAFKAIPVDTRILAATHCDLEQLVKEGKFREDLYYRLSVIPITISPLKERREDIPLLIKVFIETYTEKRGRERFSLSPKATSALINYDWRGNVRELENLIQHMSVLYSGKHLEITDLPEKFHTLATEPTSETAAPDPANSMKNQAGAAKALSPSATINWAKGQIDFNSIIDNFETELILQALKMTEGNKKEAARILGLKRTTLLEKIKKKDLGGLWEG